MVSKTGSLAPSVICDLGQPVIPPVGGDGGIQRMYVHVGTTSCPPYYPWVSSGGKQRKQTHASGRWLLSCPGSFYEYSTQRSMATAEVGGSKKLVSENRILPYKSTYLHFLSADVSWHSLTFSMCCERTTSTHYSVLWTQLISENILTLGCLLKVHQIHVFTDLVLITNTFGCAFTNLRAIQTR